MPRLQFYKLIRRVFDSSSGSKRFFQFCLYFASPPPDMTPFVSDIYLHSWSYIAAKTIPIIKIYLRIRLFVILPYNCYCLLIIHEQNFSGANRSYFIWRNSMLSSYYSLYEKPSWTICTWKWLRFWIFMPWSLSRTRFRDLTRCLEPYIFNSSDCLGQPSLVHLFDQRSMQ